MREDARLPCTNEQPARVSICACATIWLISPARHACSLRAVRVVSLQASPVIQVAEIQTQRQIDDASNSVMSAGCYTDEQLLKLWLGAQGILPLGDRT